MLKDIVPVLGCEVSGMEGDFQAVSDGLGVRKILLGGAVLGAIVFFPVFHEQALNAVALLNQQFCGDRGIHAAGHADDHGLRLWGGVIHER